jgi:hypothetical protein
MESRAHRFQPLPLIAVSDPIGSAFINRTSEGTHFPKRRQRSHRKSATIPGPESSNQRPRLGRSGRPLPVIPVPPISRPTSSQGRKRVRSRPHRPLPSPPASIPTSPIPPTPPSETRRPTRPKISIVTSLGPPTPVHLATPLSPSTPQLPTPRTAKRKQISKLSKTLGEKVPYEMMFRDSTGCVDLNQMIEVTQYDTKKMRKSGGREVKKDGKAPNHQRVSELQKPRRISDTVEKDSDSDDKHDSRWTKWLDPESKELDLAFPSEPLDVPRERISIHKKPSREWIRERDGKRWVEKDFWGVLQSLRKLR